MPSGFLERLGVYEKEGVWSMRAGPVGLWFNRPGVKHSFDTPGRWPVTARKGGQYHVEGTRKDAEEFGFVNTIRLRGEPLLVDGGMPLPPVGKQVFLGKMSSNVG
jgi:hypothetical protein